MLRFIRSTLLAAVAAVAPFSVPASAGVIAAGGLSTEPIDTGVLSDPYAGRRTAASFAVTQSTAVRQVRWLGFQASDAEDLGDFVIEFYAFNGGTPAPAPFATIKGVAPLRQDSGVDSAEFGTVVYQYSAEIPAVSLVPGRYLVSIWHATPLASENAWFWGRVDDEPGNAFAFFTAQAGLGWKPQFGDDMNFVLLTGPGPGRIRAASVRVVEEAAVPAPQPIEP